MINNVGWDWARVTMNKVNWHSAAHCKNNLISLGWEACDDLIEQKSLYAQHYTCEAQLQISQTEQSKNTDIFFEKRIIVTECSTDSSRFNLEFKMNMKSSASQWSSVIDVVTLSMWESAWEQKPVSTCQHMCSEKPVSVYSSSLSVLTCWIEQISILSWLWLHI